MFIHEVADRATATAVLAGRSPPRRTRDLMTIAGDGVERKETEEHRRSRAAGVQDGVGGLHKCVDMRLTTGRAVMMATYVHAHGLGQ